MFDLVDLGQPGREWTRQSLAEGGILAKRSLVLLDVQKGSSFGLGLSELPPGALDHLDRALARQPSRALLEACARSIIQISRGLRQVDGPQVLMVEDDRRRVNDPAILRQPRKSYIAARGRVYHVRNTREFADASDWLMFLDGSASGYPFNGWLLQSITRGQLSACLRDLRLDEIWSHTTALINSLFDGDAYAVWLPEGTLKRLSSSMGRGDASGSHAQVGNILLGNSPGAHNDRHVGGVSP
jgi:hypothetical protein